MAVNKGTPSTVARTIEANDRAIMSNRFFPVNPVLQLLQANFNFPEVHFNKSSL